LMKKGREKRHFYLQSLIPSKQTRRRKQSHTDSRHEYLLENRLLSMPSPCWALGGHHDTDENGTVGM
jgi:hypothetical protein